MQSWPAAWAAYDAGAAMEQDPGQRARCLLGAGAGHELCPHLATCDKMDRCEAAHWQAPVRTLLYQAAAGQAHMHLRGQVQWSCVQGGPLLMQALQPACSRTLMQPWQHLKHAAGQDRPSLEMSSCQNIQTHLVRPLCKLASCL